MNLDNTLKPSLILLLFSFFLALPFVYLLCTRVARLSAPFNGMLFKKKKKKLEPLLQFWVQTSDIKT